MKPNSLMAATIIVVSHKLIDYKAKNAAGKIETLQSSDKGRTSPFTTETQRHRVLGLFFLSDSVPLWLKNVQPITDHYRFSLLQFIIRHEFLLLRICPYS